MSSDDEKPKGFVQAKMAAHPKPEVETRESLPSKKDLGDMLRAKTVQRLNELDQIASNPKHPKQIEAIKTWIEYDIGRPRQAVELTGAEGGGVNMIHRIELVPVEPEHNDEA